MKIFLPIAIAALIFGIFVLVVNSIKFDNNNNMNTTSPSPAPSQSPEVSELKIEDLKVGTGDEAVAGKKVTVNYIGTLTDGTKFDSSFDRNQTFMFTLGIGEVIKGWDQGVSGMKVGGKRKLTIPPNLAYGDKILIFEVDLLEVK